MAFFTYNNKNKHSSHIMGLFLSILAFSGLHGCSSGGGGSGAAAPAITLNGDTPQSVFIGRPYVELGATALDSTGADISATIVIDSSTVNTATLGSYSVSYNVVDGTGKRAITQIRTVNVIDNQNASGLYKDGTVDLDGSAIMHDDLRAFVHDNRLLAFSVAGHLLFDGQITGITGDDYIATFDVYVQGVKTHSDINVVGKVTAQSQITGTLSGTGTASGTFTLVFDGLYNRGATFARIDSSPPLPSFEGNIMNTMVGAITTNFDFGATFYSFTSRLPGPVRCRSDALYSIPDDGKNIYVLDEELQQQEAGCTMSEAPNYTGFSAVVDGVSTDDTLLYATSNGTNAQFAVLIK